MAQETVQIADAKEYGHDAGFVIEQFRHWNGDDHKTWAIPAWEEVGMADLAGVFETRADAERALTKAA